MKVTQEHVSHPDQSFRYLRFETPRFEGEPHRHHHLELTWIEAGTGLRFVGDSVAPFAAGDLVLLGADTPHCWVSSRGRSGGAATVLQFTPELFAQPSLPELARIASLAQKSGVGLRVTGAVHRTVVEQTRGHADRRWHRPAGEPVADTGIAARQREFARNPGASLDAI